MGKIKQALKKLPGLRDISFRLKECDQRLVKLEDQIKVCNFEIEVAKRKIDKLSAIAICSKESPVLNKLAVYTVLIGDYDNLHEPKVVENDYCDYYCVTDNKNLSSSTWHMIYIDKNDDTFKELSNTKIARYVKTHPQEFLKDYKHSLFVDANLTILRSVFDWIYTYSSGKEWLTFKHPDRSCTYEEAKECVRLNKESEENVKKQVEYLKKNNFPSNYGLAMTNVIYRKHTDEVANIDNAWWHEISIGSKRDQLSLMYVFWKNNYMCDMCNLHAAYNVYFEYDSHK